LPCSRSSRVSPTHSTGTRPAALAAANLRATSALSSAWYWRRSECPTSVWLAPISASIAAETSPVYAPFSCSLTSWAPNAMPFPAHSRARPARYGKGGITIAWTLPGRLAAANSPTNAAAKSRSPFIFQFPATIRGRMYVSSKTQGRQFYLRRNLSLRTATPASVGRRGLPPWGCRFSRGKASCLDARAIHPCIACRDTPSPGGHVSPQWCFRPFGQNQPSEAEPRRGREAFALHVPRPAPAATASSFTYAQRPPGHG